jgi:hypothetical protein
LAAGQDFDEVRELIKEGTGIDVLQDFSEAAREEMQRHRTPERRFGFRNGIGRLVSNGRCRHFSDKSVAAAALKAWAVRENTKRSSHSKCVGDLEFQGARLGIEIRFRRGRFAPI